MVRLTPDIILRASEKMNPFGERELVLRGLKIPQIENTGSTSDQFQVIDLSDNEIIQLGSFALLKRLRTLNLHNNFIGSIAVNVGRSLPYLTHLNMTDNKIELLSEFDRLASFRHLETLNLQGNPVALKRNYRLYAIWKIPSLQVLDSQPVKLKERKEAKRIFDSSVGQQVETAIKAAVATVPSSSNTAAAPGTAAPTSMKTANADQVPLPTDPLERKQAIERAFLAAKTKEEIDKIEQMLALGFLPKAPAKSDITTASDHVMSDSNGSKAEVSSSAAETKQAEQTKPTPSQSKNRSASTSSKTASSTKKEEEPPATMAVEPVETEVKTTRKRGISTSSKSAGTSAEKEEEPAATTVENEAESTMTTTKRGASTSSKTGVASAKKAEEPAATIEKEAVEPEPESATKTRKRGASTSSKLETVKKEEKSATSEDQIVAEPAETEEKSIKTTRKRTTSASGATVKTEPVAPVVAEQVTEPAKEARSKRAKRG